MKLLMVGLGSMGKYHIKKFTALGFEIAGGVDTDPKAIEQAKVRYSIPWTGSRISDFHGEVDAVSIAVPDSMHRDCYLEANGIGRPLFLEKPLSRSLADAEYLNTNIKSPCMVNFSKRNISALFVLKQMLDEGQLDETYYKVRNPDIVLKPDGKQYRGISRNQICIGIACDTRNVVCFELGNGKPTKSAVKDRMGPHIIKGTTLIHDMEKAHGSLVSDLELKSIIYNSKLIKNLPDTENPLNLVNQHCRLLQQFLGAHSGFMRDDIQDYLNLYSFISNPPRDKHLKVEKFMNLAFGCRILHRYRG